MDTIKTLAVALIAALAVGAVVLMAQPDAVGGVPGVAVAPMSVTTLTEGGGVFSTTTVGTGSSLQTSDIAYANLIRVTPGGGAGVTNVTISLGASSTFPGLPNAGDTRNLIIENAASVATTTTIAAGTGIDLQEPDGQNVVIGQNNYAFITCFREVSTDIVCRVDETIPAD